MLPLQDSKKTNNMVRLFRKKVKYVFLDIFIYCNIFNSYTPLADVTVFF